MTMRIKLNDKEFIKQAKKVRNKEWPRVAAEGFAHIAEVTAEAERMQTKKQFNLSTNWIPKNIKEFPRTQGQRKRLERDIRKGDFFVSVSTTDRVAFMTGHEVGVSRTSSGDLALPSMNTKSRAYRTKTGRVKKSYLPATLLENYNRKSSSIPRGNPGKRGPNTGRSSQKKPFLMKAKSGHLMIVKRTSKKPKPIQVMYHFKKSAQIKPTWGFEKTADGTVRGSYQQLLKTAMGKGLVRNVK